MFKIKDELFSAIVELSEQHGFTVDKELLEKAITKQKISALTDDELIFECKKIFFKAQFSGNKEDYDLLSELIMRYSDLKLRYNYLIDKDIVTSEQVNESETEDDSSNEDSQHDLVISTTKGDIPVKVIKLNLDNPDMETVSNIIKSFYNIHSESNNS